jgi:hypothetical protein
LTTIAASAVGTAASSAAIAASPRDQVELDVRGPGRGGDGLDGGGRQRRAAEVGVHEDTGGVEHGSQAARRSRQRGEHHRDRLLRRHLAVPDLLLDPLDGALHQAAAQPLARRGEAGVAEQGVGARDLPAGVGAHRPGAYADRRVPTGPLTYRVPAL